MLDNSDVIGFIVNINIPNIDRYKPVDSFFAVVMYLKKKMCQSKCSARNYDVFLLEKCTPQLPLMSAVKTRNKPQTL